MIFHMRTIHLRNLGLEKIDQLQALTYEGIINPLLVPYFTAQLLSQRASLVWLEGGQGCLP